MDKLETLRKKIEEVQTKSLVASEMKAFITLVLGVVNKHKEELSNLSAENLKTIQEAVNYIEQENSKLLDNVSQETDSLKEDFAEKIKELQGLIAKVKTIKAPEKGVDYFDGKNPDPSEVVPLVLEQIKFPEPVELTGENIADKLETLEGEARLDAKAIKNLPEVTKGIVGGVVARNIYQMGDVKLTSLANDEVLKWDDTNKVWINGTGGGGGAVDSVNGATGVVVLDADDIDDTSTTNKFVTAGDITKLGNLSGTNTGDQDLSSYLTSATAASTYEPIKGADDNFVTDAEKTKLANLSGTNTGDQDLSPYFHKTNDDTDDITVGATNKFATAAEKTKLGFISVTQAVDLDTIESDTATNNAKVTNATHTGEVTGSGALTVDKTAITGKALVSAALGDHLLVADASDSDNLKKVTVQTIVDLAGGSGTTNNFNNTFIDQSGGTSDTYGVLTGAVNGANALYTVSEAVYATGTLKVWLNGQLQTQGTGEDWVETTPASGTFTFAVAPPNGSLITVEYQTVALSSDTVLTNTVIIDEDDMVSNSATHVPTQQSVKAYVDANAGGGERYSFTHPFEVLTNYNLTQSSSGTVVADGVGAYLQSNSGNGAVARIGRNSLPTTDSGFWDKDPGFGVMCHEINSAGGTGRQAFGIGSSANTLLPTDGWDKRMWFVRNTVAGTTTWYACISSGGAEANVTAVDITSSIPATDRGIFTAKLTSGVSAKFYVNGTLAATISTTLPSGNPTDANSIRAEVVNNAGDTTVRRLKVAGFTISINAD